MNAAGPIRLNTPSLADEAVWAALDHDTRAAVVRLYGAEPGHATPTQRLTADGVLDAIADAASGAVSDLRWQLRDDVERILSGRGN